MKALLVAVAAVVVALPIGLGGALVVVLTPPAASAPPSAEARADVPPALLDGYRRAAASCPGLAWAVLAAVAKVETDHGRFGGGALGANGEVAPPILGPPLTGAGGTAFVADTDAGRLDGDAGVDRALGPMQFLPATWARWGRDATGDGVADPHNAFDAAAAAAAYLCGPDGRLEDLDAALLAYSPSPAYAADVLDQAARYGSLSPTGLSPSAEVAAVLSHPNLTLVPSARRDLESGLVDPRLVAVLHAAAERFPVGVGVLKTGHSTYVAGTARVSNHFHYRAVDLFAVGGRPVTRANGAARALAELLAALPAPLRPGELGVPWPELGPLPGVFSDADHQDHLHVGYLAAPPGRRP